MELHEYIIHKRGELSLQGIGGVHDGSIMSGDGVFLPIALADYVIRSLDNHGIQRILYELESKDVAILIGSLEGLSSLRIMNNLSTHLSYIILEEAEKMGEIPASKMAGTAERVILITSELISRGEIVCKKLDMGEFMEFITLNRPSFFDIMLTGPEG